MITADKLRAKALGIVEAIKNSTPKERESIPTALFGEDYNRLREHVLLDRLDLRDALPPSVQFTTTGGLATCCQTYLEILSFAEQILKLLNTSA